MKALFFILSINFLTLHANNIKHEPSKKKTIPIQGGYYYDYSPQNMAKYLPKNPIILECGAHNGSDTIKMSKYWKDGFIYAIEASPTTYKTLVKNTKGLKNVKLFPIALGWEDGEADFHISKHPNHPDKGQCSLLASNHDAHQPGNLYTFDEIVTVPVFTLDTWAKDNHVDHIDFMWLDMQGADFKMLMASGQTLDTVKLIKVEISTIDLYTDTVLYKDGIKFLESRGFTLIVDTDWLHADALFIRTTWLEELGIEISE